MEQRGRPRKLNPLGERFRALILDPFKTPASIATELGISLRTYYRYESELALPVMRVAIGTPINLPRDLALRKMMAEKESDLLTTLAVGRHLGVRLDIIPCSFYSEPERLLRQRKVDLALAHRSFTKARAQEFYGSDHYQGQVKPCGNLFVRKGFEIRGNGRDKPVLGVMRDSVHFEFASKHLRTEFNIRSFSTDQSAFAALNSAGINAILTHESVPPFLGIDCENFEMRKKTFNFDTHSAILFHSDSVLWREGVNETIHLLGRF